MTQAKNKTVETKSSVAAFVKKIANEKKRGDFSSLLRLMSKDTKFEPKMWGTAIVGFGAYHYKYESGREGDAPLLGISPRSTSIVIYIGCDYEKSDELMAKLGKHKMSGGCLHIQKLEDIDTSVLSKMIKASVAHKKKQYPGK